MDTTIAEEYPLFDEGLYQRVAFLEHLTKQYLEQQHILQRALTDALHRIHELEEENHTNFVA